MLPPITWDGKNEGGQKVARGLYPFSVTITTSDGESARTSGSMIIL